MGELVPLRKRRKRRRKLLPVAKFLPVAVRPFTPLIALVVAAGLLAFPTLFDESGAAARADITCTNPYILDGDTLECDGRRIRLARIDAPEMPGHCREGRQCTPGDPYAARNRLSRLTRGAVTCTPIETDVYGRTVARCKAEEIDLSCAMIESGDAVRRYGMLWCF